MLEETAVTSTNPGDSISGVILDSWWGWVMFVLGTLALLLVAIRRSLPISPRCCLTSLPWYISYHPFSLILSVVWASRTISYQRRAEGAEVDAEISAEKFRCYQELFDFYLE